MASLHTQILSVSFKTLDGILLRGCLYPAEKYGPAVIMTPGVSFSPTNIVKSLIVR
jgi:hypothetical protein